MPHGAPAPEGVSRSASKREFHGAEVRVVFRARASEDGHREDQEVGAPVEHAGLRFWVSRYTSCAGSRSARRNGTARGDGAERRARSVEPVPSAPHRHVHGVRAISLCALAAMLRRPRTCGRATSRRPARGVLRRTRNDWGSHVEVSGVEAISSSAFANLGLESTIDMVVCNPPAHLASASRRVELTSSRRRTSRSFRRGPTACPFISGVNAGGSGVSLPGRVAALRGRGRAGRAGSKALRQDTSVRRGPPGRRRDRRTAGRAGAGRSDLDVAAE